MKKTGNGYRTADGSKICYEVRIYGHNAVFAGAPIKIHIDILSAQGIYRQDRNRRWQFLARYDLEEAAWIPLCQIISRKHPLRRLLYRIKYNYAHGYVACTIFIEKGN